MGAGPESVCPQLGSAPPSMSASATDPGPHAPRFSGASVMGDGGVVLILDPGELMQLAVQEAL